MFQLEDSVEPPAAGENKLDYLVSARDLRTMVEELWLAGAEAIAINGERVVPTTSIIDIGGVVLANSAYLAPPYQVAAIGSENLYEDVVGSPGFADFVRARQDGHGIRIGYLEPEAVDIPAFAGTVTLRHARPAPSEPPSSEAPASGSGARQRDAQAAQPGHDRAGLVHPGLLVVVQLRAQAAGSGLGAMSSQDLTAFSWPTSTPASNSVARRSLRSSATWRPFRPTRTAASCRSARSATSSRRSAPTPGWTRSSGRASR